MTTAIFPQSPQFAASTASVAKRRRVPLVGARPEARIAAVVAPAQVAICDVAAPHGFAAKRVGYALETVAAGIMIAGYLVLALFG
ncbi:MAG: hypothetical protein IPK26_19215 [Planctomycetes bacterium]|nr:hypothetical protein [Planctomycetota bacterium]